MIPLADCAGSAPLTSRRKSAVVDGDAHPIPGGPPARFRNGPELPRRLERLQGVLGLQFACAAVALDEELALWDTIVDVPRRRLVANRPAQERAAHAPCRLGFDAPFPAESHTLAEPPGAPRDGELPGQRARPYVTVCECGISGRARRGDQRRPGCGLAAKWSRRRRRAPPRRQVDERAAAVSSLPACSVVPPGVACSGARRLSRRPPRQSRLRDPCRRCWHRGVPSGGAALKFDPAMTQPKRASVAGRHVVYHEFLASVRPRGGTNAGPGRRGRFVH